MFLDHLGVILRNGWKKSYFFYHRKTINLDYELLIMKCDWVWNKFVFLGTVSSCQQRSVPLKVFEVIGLKTLD